MLDLLELVIVVLESVIYVSSDESYELRLLKAFFLKDALLASKGVRLLIERDNRLSTMFGARHIIAYLL